MTDILQYTEVYLNIEHQVRIDSGMDKTTTVTPELVVSGLGNLAVELDNLLAGENLTWMYLLWDER